MSNAIETQIKERIQAFATELDLLVRKNMLDALRGILEGRAAPARRGRRPGRPARAERPAAAAGREDLVEKIASAVRANPGRTVGEIVSATGARSAAVKQAIKGMLADRQIRKAGQKRGTRYFPPGAGRLPGSAPKGTGRAKRRGRKAKKARASKARRTASKTRRAARRASAKVVVPARRRAARSTKPPVPASAPTEPVAAK